MNRTKENLSRARKHWIWLLLVVRLVGLRASAQIQELLPEIDVHYKLASDVRLSFQAKETREGGGPTQAEIGPTIELYLKPLVKLKKIARLELDDSKPRPLTFAIGYRYLSSPSSPEANRLEPVVTFHYPLMVGVLVSDRNRADLDWKNGTFSWRYRNLFQIEKRLTIHSYHPAPYAGVEFFYQSQYAKWSDTAIYVGCLLPIGSHLEFDPYYEHQNNTGSPNQQLNQLGLKLSIFF